MIDVLEYFKNTPKEKRDEDFEALAPVKAAYNAAKENMQEAGAGCVSFGQRPLGRRCGRDVACIAFTGVVNSVTCPHFNEGAACEQKCLLQDRNKKYVVALQEYKVAKAAYDNFWDARVAERQK